MPDLPTTPAALAAFPNRRTVEREIQAAENPAPGTMHLNDGHERVRLPGGTLRRMLATIDQLAALASQAREAAEVPADNEPLGPVIGWMRLHPNGDPSGEYLSDAVIEDVRRRSGQWVPLIRQPLDPTPAGQYRRLFMQAHEALDVLAGLHPELTTDEPAEMARRIFDHVTSERAAALADAASARRTIDALISAAPPAPAAEVRVPLTDEQIGEGWTAHDANNPWVSSRWSFDAGVRFAETHHGIAPLPAASKGGAV